MAAAPRDDLYLAARQEYSDRYAQLAAGKRNWQFTALGFFLIAVMTSAISIIKVRQVKRIPYVVAVDPRRRIRDHDPYSDQRLEHLHRSARD